MAPEPLRRAWRAMAALREHAPFLLTRRAAAPFLLIRRLRCSTSRAITPQVCINLEPAAPPARRVCPWLPL